MFRELVVDTKTIKAIVIQGIFSAVYSFNISESVSRTVLMKTPFWSHLF